MKFVPRGVESRTVHFAYFLYFIFYILIKYQSVLDRGRNAQDPLSLYGLLFLQRYGPCWETVLNPIVVLPTGLDVGYKPAARG